MSTTDFTALLERADPEHTAKRRTKRGEATRRKVLEAAEDVFAEFGYHDASISRITERAGVAMGTFYLYFDSKQTIFEALVIDLNRRVRHAMAEAMAGAGSRIEAERAGFRGFFNFTAEHPALYRVVREDEVLSQVMLSESAVKRLVEPAEVASLVAWLCSDDAGMVTGASYTMDGGWTSR